MFTFILVILLCIIVGFALMFINLAVTNWPFLIISYLSALFGLYVNISLGFSFPLMLLFLFLPIVVLGLHIGALYSRAAEIRRYSGEEYRGTTHTTFFTVKTITGKNADQKNLVRILVDGLFPILFYIGSFCFLKTEPGIFIYLLLIVISFAVCLTTLLFLKNKHSPLNSFVNNNLMPLSFLAIGFLNFMYGIIIANKHFNDFIFYQKHAHEIVINALVQSMFNKLIFASILIVSSLVILWIFFVQLKKSFSGSLH